MGLQIYPLYSANIPAVYANIPAVFCKYTRCINRLSLLRSYQPVYKSGLHLACILHGSPEDRQPSGILI